VQLRKADVVEGALTLLDAEGLDGLTMRKLAAALDVQAGALYWHFDNKQALLDAMAEKLLEGVGAPVPAGAWDEQLTILARRLRAGLLAHRDGARVLAGSYVAEFDTLAIGRTAVAILCRAGIPVERAGWITFAFYYYVLGHVVEEQSQRELVKGDHWQARLASASADDSLYSSALLSVFTADATERFAYGLELFLDGIRRRLAELGGEIPPRPASVSTASSIG
jgi:TetR/AcrR family tetracycline transcriptional repressor